jgi:hypothetical protein
MLRNTLTISGLICVMATSSAFAQRTSTTGGTNRGGNTTSGLFGSRTIGSGSIQSGGNSLFGSSGNRSTGTTTQQQELGNVTGSERFINSNRNAAQNFVGADINEVRAVGAVGAGNTGNNAQRGFQNAFNQFRQLNQFQQFANNAFGQQNRNTQVRIGLTLGFTPAPTAAGPLSAAVEQRLTRLPGVNLVGTPQLALEGRTAVVRGVAASERDREMVSRLLLLEPGISDVRNEMTVGPATATPGSIPN